MGYRIEYHSDTDHKFPANKTRSGWKKKIIIVVLAIILAAGAIASKENTQLSLLLFPGDPEVTQAAFSGMLEGIRAGEAVKDAFTTFCIEIIEHAENS